MTTFYYCVILDFIKLKTKFLSANRQEQSKNDKLKEFGENFMIMVSYVQVTISFKVDLYLNKYGLDCTQPNGSHCHQDLAILATDIAGMPISETRQQNSNIISLCTDLDLKDNSFQLV